MSFMIAGAAALGLLLVYDGISNRQQGRARPLVEHLQELIHDSGIRHLTAARLLVSCACSCVLAFVVVAGITGSLVIAGVICAGASWAPISIVRSYRDKRRRTFREAWPDAIASLVAGVRAGVSLPEACVALVERGPKDLKPGFRAFVSTFRSTGSFRAGLQRLRDELADPVGDRVVVALSVAHDVGGTDLVRVLRTLGDFVREDLRVRKEIEARWSWTVTAARVAAAAPWIVLLVMSTRPQAAAAYNSSGGVAVLAGGAVATLVGYRLMLKVAHLPDDRRLST
jgi:tight adherence protein B